MKIVDSFTNELRRRAGLKEAQEVFGPDSGIGDDALDAEDARADAIHELETQQKVEIAKKLMQMGYSKYDLEDNIRIIVDFQGDAVEYSITFTAVEFTVRQLVRGISLGLWTEESKVSGGAHYGLDIETSFPANETVFAQFTR